MYMVSHGLVYFKIQINTIMFGLINDKLKDIEWGIYHVYMYIIRSNIGGLVYYYKTLIQNCPRIYNT